MAILLLSPALRFNDAQNNRDAAYLPKSAESLDAIHLEEQGFGDELLTGLLVYRSTDGIGSSDRAAIDADLRSLKNKPLRNQYSTPKLYYFGDGKTAGLYAQVKTFGEADVLFEVSDRMRGLGGDNPPGLVSKLTGPMGYFDDTVTIFHEIDGKLLIGTGILISILLLLIYRSPFLWLVPLGCVGLAEIVGRGISTLIADGGTTITSQSAALMTVMIFGVGTDYALLVVARFREELRRHESHHVAMSHALRSCGPTILASAATVALALMCMALADVNSTANAGPIGALGIAVAMLVMMTLLPVLLVLLGRTAFWPHVPGYGSPDQYAARGIWRAAAGLVTRRPRLISVAVFGLMAAMAMGLFAYNGGLNAAEGFANDVEANQGKRLLERALPPGATGPMTVVMRDGPAREGVIKAVKDTPGVGLVALEQRDNGIFRAEVFLTSEPYGDAAIATVDRVRAAIKRVAPAGAYVAGPTAVEADSRRAADRDNRVVMPLALVVVMLVLLILLRALVAPVMLIITVVCSFIATLGVSYVAYRYVFGFSGVDEFVPLFVFMFLVALGVDYNIFLMARIREEADKFGTHIGIRRGLIATGGVITSAGVVLSGTFLVLATMPFTMLTEIGFAIAVGVIFDTLVVRSLLVPALGSVLGRNLWWPRRIDADQKGPSIALPESDDIGNGSSAATTRSISGASDDVSPTSSKR